jgi:hypothetical protein
LCADGADQDIFYLSSMAHQGEDKSSPSVESSGLGEITKTERVG